MSSSDNPDGLVAIIARTQHKTSESSACFMAERYSMLEKVISCYQDEQCAMPKQITVITPSNLPIQKQHSEAVIHGGNALKGSLKRI